MQTEADYFALFEAYQRGELAAGAQAGLEARLGAEPRLHQLYAEYLELTGTLSGYAERRRTRQQIAGLHAAMLAAEATPAPATEAPVMRATVNPRLRISRTEQKLRDFWYGYRATVGVAASVAVLAVFSTLLGLDLWRSANTAPASAVTSLRLDMARIKHRTDALTKKVNNVAGATVPVAPVRVNKYSGTGFALTTDGYLVTSAHVVDKSADSLLVESRDHQRYRVELVYSDIKHDLAILRIKDKGFKPFAKLPYTFKAGQADLGERVYTLGYPREDVVYGEGALSARSGYDGDTAFYQVSIPLNPGNSGGPLLDAQGNLIGVVSSRQDDVLGAAFATKSSFLVRLVDSLRGKQPAAAYHLPRVNTLAGTNRPQQLKRLQDYVFVVKVYEK